MDLTALDIKQQTFARALRGYDVSEVSSYLQLVSSNWEHMVSKNKELEKQLAELNEKLKHYARVEEALHETLQTAKDSAEQRLNAAKKEAQSKIERAEMESETILQKARQERQSIRQSAMRLLERREEIIRGMQSYLSNAQESLQAFKTDKASIFTIPQEELTDQESQAQSSPNALPRIAKLGNKISKKPTTSELDMDDLIDDLD